MSDNQIKVQVVPGMQTSANPALLVQVQRTVPKVLASFFSPAPVTVTANSQAELVTFTTITAGSGGQPCLVALSNTGTVSGQGSTYWTMPGCTVRSNGTVDVHGGGGPLNTAGIYAGGAVNIDTWISTTGGQYPNRGTISDPYLSNTTLQNHFTATAALSSPGNIACGSMSGVLGSAGQYTGTNNCNGTNTLPNGGACVTSSGVTCTLYPGDYGSFSATGGPYVFNFRPGLYRFKGNIALTNNTTSNGTGVTILSTGVFTGSNSFNFNIAAPTTTQASNTGGIAGVALTSNNAATATISGNAAFNITGVAYFPNAIFDASGSSCNSTTPCFGTNSTTCLEIVAQSIKLTGNSNFSSSCSGYGVAVFTSIGGSTTSTASARLVQ